MFRDDNEEFLRSLQEINTGSNEAPIINIYEPQPVNSFEQQVKMEYNILKQYKRQGDRSNDQSLDNEPVNEIKKTLKITKRQSIIGSCFSKTRKLSGDNICTWNDSKEEINKEQAHKSQGSDENDENIKYSGVGDEFDKKSKGYAFNLNQSEGTFWKKIRNLQTRLKNLNLNNNTLVIKTKQQNTKLQKQKGYYQNFFLQKYPHLLSQVNAYIAKRIQEQQQQFLDSSSQSSKAGHKNDEWMPILSKVQQIKIDVTKVFEVIKEYQQKLVKFQRENNLLNNSKQEQLRKQGSIFEEKRIGIIRKFSIPAKLGQHFNNNRFYPTRIANQYSTFKIQTNTLCQYCKQPRMEIFQTDQRNQKSEGNPI